MAQNQLVLGPEKLALGELQGVAPDRVGDLAQGRGRLSSERRLLEPGPRLVLAAGIPGMFPRSVGDGGRSARGAQGPACDDYISRIL